MSKVVQFVPCPRCQANGRDTRGDNLAIYYDDSKHCFACGFHTFPKHYVGLHEPIPKQIKRLLPNDWQREVPRHALQWLLQWELPYSYWKENIGYSPKEERLVFRVGSPQLAFSIGRYLPVGEPTERPRKWYVWGNPDRHCEVIGARPDGAIILVEDLISAHKVGQVSECIPLFGTVVHNAVLYYLMNSSKPVKFWLDKDQESPVKKKAVQLQSLIDRPVDIIVTDKDPKCLDLKKIQSILN